jgi:ABC-type multidrug transport system fused ATPase/permease subunit
MTVERIKTPKEVKKFQDNLPLISVGTAMTTLSVAERVVEGRKPIPADVTKMVQQVAEDLSAQGITSTPDDIKAVEKETVEQLKSPGSNREPIKEKKLPLNEPLPDVDLKEYQRIVDDMVRNYGFDKDGWATIGHMLGLTTVTGDLIAGKQRYMFATDEGRNKLTSNFRAIGTALNLKGQTPSEFVKTLPDRMKKRGVFVRNLFVESAWPFLLSPVYSLMERQVGKMAGRMFMKERVNLQEQVNNRIADSLFMRNFEFLNNTSSGEMLEIINRGKDATIDLMSAIYEELIPLKYAMWGSVGRQFLSVGSWTAPDAWFGMVKKFVLETRIKPNAQKIQLQRNEELRQWDKVNTKLLTTLQGLETARTSGNTEAGSDVLYGALAERDYVESGGLRERRQQDEAMNKLFDILDFALPVGAEGVSLYNLSKQDINPKTGKPFTAYDLANHLADAYFRVTGSQGEQQALRQMAMQLTHLYVNRIIPNIQDIKRMEEILGPYQELDHPFGLRERSREPVSTLKNFDISVKDLRFKHILNGVNLDIPQGSFTTIKGPSGIGKSTLFRHLVGLYTGEGGQVQYGGVELDHIKKYGDQSLYTKIAYANQNPQYFEDMTLRENLLLWTDKKMPEGKVETVLRDLKLDQLIDRLDSNTKHFSGGELRRIGIARALLKDPKVLFLDEPTANLDAASSQQVMNIIMELRRNRPDMTVVAITHDPVFEKIAERIVDFADINPKAASSKLGENQIFEDKAKAG